MSLKKTFGRRSTKSTGLGKTRGGLQGSSGLHQSVPPVVVRSSQRTLGGTSTGLGKTSTSLGKTRGFGTKHVTPIKEKETLDKGKKGKVTFESIEKGKESPLEDKIETSELVLNDDDDSDSGGSSAYIDEDERAPASVVDQDIFIEQSSEVPVDEVVEIEGLGELSSFTWNDRFQAILAKKHTTRQEKVERVVAIRRLLSEFEAKAKEFAVTIVDELHLPKEKKSVPPIDAGGVAGGQKFCTEGIFFKLAIDWKKVYSGNDAAAMKAAGHELNGLRAYFRSKVKGLYVPLMVAIDYRGYRLLASSILPISGTKTLVYGSPDAGKTVNKSNTDMNDLMEKAAMELNLKPHYAGHKTSKKLLHGPVDLEGHVGLDDKFYVLDTARVFPPESPTRAVLVIPEEEDEAVRVEQLPDAALGNKEFFIEAIAKVIHTSPGDMGIMHNSMGTFYYNTKANENKRAMLLMKKGSEAVLFGDVLVVQYNTQVIYYRLLRPELVHDNRMSHYNTGMDKTMDKKLPLCSDAFSRFQLWDENLHEHNREVTEATYRLLNRVIPSFARKLKTHKLVPVDHSELVQEMHAAGINVRFLGRIRMRVDASLSHLRSFLLTEICARVMKHKIRKILRKACSTSRKRHTPHAQHNHHSEGVQQEDQLYQRLVNYFNKCLGKSVTSTQYWMGKLKLHIQFKFMHALAEDEARVDYDLRKVVLMFPLFMRLQETTGVVFKTAVQTRLFEHPYLFDIQDPLRPDDLHAIEPKTKNIFVRTGELKNKLYKALTLEREKESDEALTSNFDARDDIMEAYSTLINLYHHKQIADYISANSPEAIQSYYKLAQSYKRMGNTPKALDFALKGLYYGEVLFGSYSEETMEGLRTVGEIFEHAGKEEETIEFYGRALQAVEKMYFLHPIAGKLHLKLYFLLRERASGDARVHLQKAYAAYGGIYGYEKARLVVPLLALKNNVQNVIKKMDETLAGCREASLMQLAYQFWPAELLDAVSSAVAGDGEGRVKDTLTRLDLEEHILSFQYHEVDDETFLALTDDDLREIGIKHSSEREKLLNEIESINEVMKEEARLAMIAASEAGEDPYHSLQGSSSFQGMEIDEYTIDNQPSRPSKPLPNTMPITTAEIENSFISY